MLRERRRQWCGHVMRKDDDGVEWRRMEMKVEGRGGEEGRSDEGGIEDERIKGR